MKKTGQIHSSACQIQNLLTETKICVTFFKTGQERQNTKLQNLTLPHAFRLRLRWLRDIKENFGEV